MSTTLKTMNIYHINKLIGEISFDSSNDQFAFIYDKDWIKNGFVLSPALAFHIKISSNSISRFLENLLPEGSGLDILLRNTGVSKNNLFALISAIGKETAGALTFADEIPTLEPIYREVSTKELAKRIAERKEVPISYWDGRPRLSVAGVQDKLPILNVFGMFGFGEGSLASTHILKFEKEKESIVFNEYLSMNLARDAGLGVAPVEIVQIEEHKVLSVTRFDREFNSKDDIGRLHMMDGCQALNYSSSQKYERSFGSGEHVKDYRDGATFKDIFAIASLCNIPIVVKKNMITWLCVNLCLGNSDAHAKNISFMLRPGSCILGLFYDIVNITVYGDKYDTGFAMSIDDAFDYEELGTAQVNNFCEDNAINLRLFVKEFFKVSKAIKRQLESDFYFDSSEKDFYYRYKKDVLDRLDNLDKIVGFCIEYKETSDDEYNSCDKTNITGLLRYNIFQKKK